MTTPTKFITFLLVAAIIGGGITLRLLSTRYATLAEDTLTPYYFDKFQRLATSGHFPSDDVWEWAPGPFPENVPPGLAYISLATFRISAFFSPTLSLLDFANIFPVIAFFLWCALALFVWRWQRKNADVGIVLLAVLAFTPVTISLTSFANYTQEVLGVFLLFLSLFTLATLPVNVKNAAIVTVIVTIFILTWQQFPIFYLVTLPILLWLTWKHRFREAAWHAGILATALIASELAVRLLVKSDYSTLAMIKEFLLGFWLGFRDDPDMLTAMVRGNWRHVGVVELFRIYGPLTLSLLATGVAVSLNRMKETKYQLALTSALMGLVMVLMFEKEKSLAFGLFLFPVALAIDAIFVGEFAEDVSRIFVWLKNRVSRKLIALTTMTILLLGGWFFLTRVPEGIALITKRNPPKPEIAVSHQKNLDGTIDVKLRMINRGGTTFSSNRLWPGLNSGMHVEVCGADIVRSDPYSPTAEYAWRYQSVYSFARWGDCYFTEIKFRQLRKNQWGEAVFTIKPWTTDKPSLYYRAWMTETSCIIDYKKSSGETPEEQKLLESEGEPCIVRSPTNKDTSQPLCPVQVMAARMGLQDFRCGSSILAQ